MKQFVSYAYDAFDRRVSKNLDSDANGTANRYEFYIWDGDDIVIDFVDSDGGGSPSASATKRYLHGLAIDEILAEETFGGATAWHLADHQGTVRDLADGDGNLVGGSHVSYNSFGKILSGTPASRFAYTGQEYDPDTGLYYYNARWYDPGTGKFITKDPIGFGGGDTNQYRYVGNDAANAIDPSGLEKQNHDDLVNHGEGGGYVGGGLNPANWWRWLYTGDANCADDAYDAALNAGGESVTENGPKAKAALDAVDTIDPTPLSSTLGAGIDYSLGNDEDAKFALETSIPGPLGDAARRAKQAKKVVKATDELSDGAKRMAKWGENWAEADVQKAIRRHGGPNATAWVTDTGKLVIENPTTFRQVVVDSAGYFRILNPNVIGGKKGQYLNMMGKSPSAPTKGQFEAGTHFKF